jgi:hypothetical protein
MHQKGANSMDTLEKERLRTNPNPNQNFDPNFNPNQNLTPNPGFDPNSNPNNPNPNLNFNTNNNSNNPSYRSNSNNPSRGEPFDSDTRPNEANIAPKKEFKVIDKVDYRLTKVEFAYPFYDLAVGQGFFVPLEYPNTMDTLVYSVHRQVMQYKLANSEVELNEDGDEVLENVTVLTKARNPDGSFKLGPDGQPKIGGGSVTRHKLIGPSFMVKAVRKGDRIVAGTPEEIDTENKAIDQARADHKEVPINENTQAVADGVLVIRVD